jgi:hypothetical protein
MDMIRIEIVMISQIPSPQAEDRRRPSMHPVVSNS